MLPPFFMIPRQIGLVTFCGISMVADTGAAVNYGTFTIPSDGLLIALCTAYATNAQTVSSVSIGGTNGTINSYNGDGNKFKSAVAYRQVTAGTANVTLNLSGNNGSFSRNACAVWILARNRSDTPLNSGLAFTNASGSTQSLSLNYPGDGWGFYLAGEGDRTISSWSGATQVGSVSGTASDGTTHKFYAAQEFLPTATTALNETVTWASAAAGNYILGGTWS